MNHPNVDYQEIAKFDAQGEAWWDLQGPFRPLHIINPLRLGFVQQHVNLENKKVADIGCGGGILAESMANLGANVTGIDLSEAAIHTAKQHAAQNNVAVDYQIISAMELAQMQTGQYDVVTCMELLEHVPDPAEIIQACAKLIKPTGAIFFSTINRNLKAYLLAILGAEYILRWVPKGTHEYEKFIRPSELEQWARAANLSVKEFKGMVYRPLSREFQLSNNIDVNYLVYCTRRD